MTMHICVCVTDLIDLLIGMLLVSRSGLAEENALDVLQCSLCPLFLDVKFEVFSGRIVMWQYFRFLSTYSFCQPTLWFIRLKGEFPILRTRSCPYLYPLIHHPRRPLALGRILIPGFIRSLLYIYIYICVFFISSITFQKLQLSLELIFTKCKVSMRERERKLHVS